MNFPAALDYQKQRILEDYEEERRRPTAPNTVIKGHRRQYINDCEHMDGHLRAYNLWIPPAQD